MADKSFWDTFSSGFSEFSDGVSDFFNVGSTVSQSSNMNADDVFKTKSALNAVGNYTPSDFGITDIPDMGMINGIKDFQANKGLKVDGVMKPGGPTENALGQTLVNQGITNTDLLEKVKIPPITPPPDVPKPANISSPPQTSWSATAPLGEISKPSRAKLPKIDPMTGLVDPLASTPKGKMPTKKQWEEVAKMQKAKTAIVPEGETVEQRIRSMMSDKRYGDKNDTRLRDHIQKQFQRAYPGTVEYDETGKMIQPKAAIQANEVEPFDPNGELKTEENNNGQTWCNGAVHEEGAMPEDENQSQNIRQGHAATASEVSQTQLDPGQEVAQKPENEGLWGDVQDAAQILWENTFGSKTAMADAPKNSKAPTQEELDAAYQKASTTTEKTEASKDSFKNFSDIDVGFIHDREGSRSELYIPKKNNGDYDGNSGATIGHGVDIGQMNEHDLQRLVDVHGLDPATAEKLKPYLGLTKQEAQNRIDAEAKKNGGPFRLSKAELANLNKAKYDQIFTTVEKLYNRDSSVKFRDLPPAAQTVIASVALQHGAGLYKATPRFWHHITNQDWQSTFDELNVFEDEWPDRRKLEADYLSRILDR